MNETASPPLPPGLLIRNALIHTQDPARPLASILAANGPELIYTGDDIDEARAILTAPFREIDLGGLTVIPGLIDGHAHLIGEGQRLAQLNLHGLDFQQTLAAVKKEADNRPDGEWILGLGWNQEEWPGGSWPHRRDLAEAAPDNPVVLDRMDKHSVWVNSLALRLGGLKAETPNPPGGEYLKDENGDLQGILIGNGMWAVKKAQPQEGLEGLRRDLLRAQQEMLSFGITSVMDAGLNMETLSLIRDCYARGQMKLRVRGMMLAYDQSDEAYIKSGGGPLNGLYGERFALGGVKIHSDGSLGSRSAWLSRDYADRPGHRGGHSFNDEELYKIMKRARDHGLIISIHAIGDAAIHQALIAMRKALGPEPGDHRWRIEHFQVVQPKDMDLALELGVIPSIQTVGLMNDLHMAGERLGPELIERSYPWREVLDRGGILVNGADGPVESVNPFEGMYAAVSRRDLSGRPDGGWRPQDKLSRLEALSTYTTWSAYSEFSEQRKGRLAPGYLADFAVIDRDCLSCPEDEIKDIKVEMTVLGGEILYQRP